ncbi:MAG: hypothetical protein A3J79_02780 [Elusimicrobia bacterium RIFOXYB2_FULL_62_6]|nr:MAG: hypothetical protein A3J79_02780 [Elusimicrobia bacterium RIFOXYB2_FULL_62_6]
MTKRFMYGSFFILLAAFVFLPGLITHGEDGEDADEGPVKGQLSTGYVKSEEGVTGEMNSEPGSGEPAQARTQAVPGGETAEGAGGVGIMGSDAGGKAPADFYMNLPAPTPREAQANLSAYLNGMALATAQTKLIGLRLLNSAYTFLGIPYQFNGRGDCVHGIDCSKLTRCAAIKAKLEPTSFVALAGAQYGYALKKQYNMQMVSTGSPASLANVQPGDFLFFNWRDAFSRARPYSIGHVALYIGPTKGSSMYLIEAGNPVQKRWGNQKYLVGVGRIVK